MNSKFVSVDIETTGLDPETCQTIEIGAVIADWNDPEAPTSEFHCYVLHPQYKGDPYALSMHPHIFRSIARDEGRILPAEHVMPELHEWLAEHFGHVGPYTVAGKNFAGFDQKFLDKLPQGPGKMFHHRVLDPGCMFWNPFVDEVPPNQKTCLERAGIADEVTHNALDDARQVVSLIQAHVLREL
ncbi:MAG: 3'-5' exonuclease [Planctomycetota bacterium]|jgi:DNA polymerase III epsilon subunit-like protein